MHVESPRHEESSGRVVTRFALRAAYLIEIQMGFLNSNVPSVKKFGPAKRTK